MIVMCIRLYDCRLSIALALDETVMMCTDLDVMLHAVVGIRRKASKVVSEVGKGNDLVFRAMDVVERPSHFGQLRGGEQERQICRLSSLPSFC